MSDSLTLAQDRVLGHLAHCHRQQGYMPSLAEIAKTFGWSSANAADTHINALARMGYVERAAGVARGLRLTPKALAHFGAAPAAASLIALPVVDPALVARAARARAA